MSGAQAQVYDLPLDSLSEWTGKKSIRVVSNIDGLSADKEFLALLGRLNIKGFDVKFGGSGSSEEGLILEVLQISDKIAVSIKSTDSQKYLFSVLIDENDQSEVALREEVSSRSVLPLPEDFNPKMVEALSWSDREEDQLVFLSDSSLVLGVFDGNRIKELMHSRPASKIRKQSSYRLVSQTQIRIRRLLWCGARPRYLRQRAIHEALLSTF